MFHSPDHQAVNTGDKGTPMVFIRTEVVRGDTQDALEMAKPREYETVLNTVPLY